MAKVWFTFRLSPLISIHPSPAGLNGGSQWPLSSDLDDPVALRPAADGRVRSLPQPLARIAERIRTASSGGRVGPGDWESPRCPMDPHGRASDQRGDACTLTLRVSARRESGSWSHAFRQFRAALNGVLAPESRFRRNSDVAAQGALGAGSRFSHPCNRGPRLTLWVLGANWPLVAGVRECHPSVRCSRASLVWGWRRALWRMGSCAGAEGREPATLPVAEAGRDGVDPRAQSRSRWRDRDA